MFGRAEPAHLQRRGAPAHLYTRLMLLLRALTLLALCGAAIATNAAGLAFLTANKAKEGVVELPSGLQYKVLRKGSGDSHPTVNSPCECPLRRPVRRQLPGRPEVRLVLRSRLAHHLCAQPRSVCMPITVHTPHVGPFPAHLALKTHAVSLSDARTRPRLLTQ